MKRMFVKMLWYDDLGRQRVLGRIMGVGTMAMMTFTFLKVYGFNLEIWQMAGIVLTWYLVEIICGYIYAKLNLMEIETDLYNEQNQKLRKL